MFWDKFSDGTMTAFRAPFLATESLFVLYLVAALFLAVVVYLRFSNRDVSDRPDGISRGLIGYIFDKNIWFHPSARQDYVFYLVNSVIYSGAVAQLILSGPVVLNFFEAAFAAIFGPLDAPLLEPTTGSALLYAAAVILGTDLAIFLAHYAHHKFPPLWHFHAVHHSAEVLTVATVFRQHPVDLFLTGSLVVILSQFAVAGFEYLTMSEVSVLLVMNLNIFIFVFFLLGYNLRHSHIWLNYPPWLSYIFISPAQHQTHHSVDEKHFDKNFGFIFSLWDWLFGTLYVPRGYERLEFGLSRAEPNPFKSVTDLYLMPFGRSWKEIRAYFKRTSSEGERRAQPPAE